MVYGPDINKFCDSKAFTTEGFYCAIFTLMLVDIPLRLTPQIWHPKKVLTHCEFVSNVPHPSNGGMDIRHRDFIPVLMLR